ncbi:SDR family NAD(P)-dependent oxidoreductase [Streptomyces sp. Ac-502]|uniref:type I polyketide synthase n=1 Tax=Streptomyces sp. Ac-502 TaxID=3342801 RepID=UPI0038625C3A
MNASARPSGQHTQASSRKAVAIVGMACRLPGGVDSSEDLWNMIVQGRHGISPVPRDRGWDLLARQDDDRDRSGAYYVHGGGFLPDPAGFDAQFFNVSPREALAMHPQQRLFMEISWEALERAQLLPQSLHGTDAAVFAGAFDLEYGPRLHQSDTTSDGHLLTGHTGSVLSGRLAYHLGLLGPAVTVDTSCSSALTAVHLAVRALRDGECSLALAGGVSVMGTPGLLVDFSRQGVLAGDGHSRSFSRHANGFGPGEGAVVFVLEPYERALRGGRPVLAVIRGTALNQDGASDNLTSPRQSSQEAVIRAALADAGLTPADIDLVEAHGTGTRKGDPIEAHAVLATYGQGRPAGRPAYLGSVKSNIGHTMAAAGGAGLMKAVLALQHDVLPRSRHCEQPSSAIRWDAGHVRLLDENRPWPDPGQPRRAAISSYGISGTNAHLILEQAPAGDRAHRHEQPEPASGPARGPLPSWVLSARTPQALRAQAQCLLSHLSDRPEARAADVGWSLAATRTAFTHRAVVTASTAGGRHAALAALEQGGGNAELVTATATPGARNVFVFPGQGSQWAGMGRELLETSEAFTDRIHACAAALDPHTGWSLLDVLRGTRQAPDLSRVDVVQPALFAMMVALAHCWSVNGVAADAVIGHSQGEIAAACVAGILTLQDAARVVALRSKALTRIAGHGGMASLALGEHDTTGLLGRWDGRLSLAAVNSPAATLVSGDAPALRELLDHCQDDGIWARAVAVDYASHSSHVEALQEHLTDALATVRPHAGTLTMYSTVTAQALRPLEANAAYWYRNLRHPVRLEQTLRAALADGPAHFIEVSPHPVLTTALNETAQSAGIPAGVLGTLRREDGGTDRLRRAQAEAWATGVHVDWSRVFSGSGARTVDLPTYPFQRRRYWPDAITATDATPTGLDACHHPLLSTMTELPTGEWLMTGTLPGRAESWWRDHAVHDTALLPGTAFVELALQAATATGTDRVEELLLEQPLLLSHDAPGFVQVRVGPAEDDGHRVLTIHTRPADAPPGTPWARNATGALAPGAPARTEAESSGSTPCVPWPPADVTAVDLEGAYDRLAATGYRYGPAFRCLTALWRDDQHPGTLYAESTLPSSLSAEARRCHLHPALSDSVLHGLLIETGDRLLLPFVWRDIRLHATGATALRARLARCPDTDEVALYLTDQHNHPVVTVEALSMRPVTAHGLRTPAAAPSELWRLSWPQQNGATGTRRHHARGRGAVIAGPAPSEAEAAHAEHYPDIDALVTAESPAADWHLVDCSGLTDQVSAEGVHEATSRLLSALQTWLCEERFARTTLFVRTRRAVATEPGEPVDWAQAALWGLVRSAQSEHPGRLVLLDADDHPTSLHAMIAAASSGDAQVALRHGAVRKPRLERAGLQRGLCLPATEDWRLDTGADGALHRFALRENPEAAAPLGPGQVRVRLRAAGLNFRDLLLALDMVEPNAFGQGFEGAGIIEATGAGVSDLNVGDAVTGLFSATSTFAPRAVTDHRYLTRMPQGWTFADAAAIPVAYLTAAYALTHLASLGPGQKVLIHAAAGGVGTAAVHLARHLGAEVFATASPHKWPALRQWGLDDAHLASSRTLQYATDFRTTAGERTFDIVLNSLAGNHIDASLGLLRPGGHFLEMGRTDLPASQAAARHYPDIVYQSFDLSQAPEPDLHELLEQIRGKLDRGDLAPLPVTAFDVRHAAEAFTYMRQAQHVGKIVLTLPQPLDPDGTVLITGGTGTLGATLARHLITRHGVRHLTLTSRQGPHAAGAQSLHDELTALGAQIDIRACDTADAAALARLLDKIDPAHPLTGIVHAAGVLRDATFTTLTPEALKAVLRPKADAAWNLHQLTQDQDLAAFVLYSSMAGQLGTPGQANYAAANTALDALAHHRRLRGLPALSVSWGYWEQTSGMTAHLTTADRDRLRHAGLTPLTSTRALAALDAALALPDAHVAATPVDASALRAQSAGSLPPLLAHLKTGPQRVNGTAPEAGPSPSPTGMPPGPERQQAVLALILRAAAEALGHGQSTQLDPSQSFKSAGFDSLVSVQLRNRLNQVTGLRLTATAIFDHPTPHALALHIDTQLTDDSTPPKAPASEPPKRPPPAGTMRWPSDSNAPAAPRAPTTASPCCAMQPASASQEKAPARRTPLPPCRSRYQRAPRAPPDHA